MPSLMRFITIILIAAAAIYAGMFALATLVTPRQSELSEKIELNIPDVAKPEEAPATGAEPMEPVEPAPEQDTVQPLPGEAGQ